MIALIIRPKQHKMLDNKKKRKEKQLHVTIIEILAKCNVSINKINHIEYFIQAFTHKSYCVKDIYPSHILNMAKNELNNPSNLLELFDKSYE